MHHIQRIILYLDHTYGEGNENVKIAKAALEKQIPKKPVNYSIDNRGYMIYECECPNCQHSRREAYLFAYCENCGQAIDWSDTK